MIDLLEIHASVWKRIQPQLMKQRLPQALLFIGSRHSSVLQFCNRLMAMLLCEEEIVPCGQCRPCHLLLQGIHPDINYIRQDSPGGPIKIEQIRGLQQTIYQTSQQGKRRFIVIDPADKMNISAANALLKVLEEPPENTSFILIAEQMSSLPATILSRCQKYIFPSPEGSIVAEDARYLTMGQFYLKDSVRAELVKHSAAIIAALCELLEGTSSPCSIAAQWSSYAFEDIVWLLYLVTAQAINYQLLDRKTVLPGNEKLNYFSQRMQAVNLFKQLDEITDITQKVNHNINVNQTLVLEDLLLGYLGP